ncbi:MAG: L-carnitine dehydrogenase [Ilumatobacter sp.]|jgi:carnitine 3-dehydrogenase|nr:L-carnitine dehydrogenase [Ilumatobacter sp.]MBT5275714.1 L-carnitine dehydrogenase [Ilumatobacter sp.]MDG0977581.1 3-hydroxyacyl-CoA dehydrogenase NAD-binding domain-containing protein [Ilumatobacter sp.]MDG1390519.1 3-hydroxyacyl-CoA dehydrogenase NAD-binding domain-containing protein [Ilumatobacter sp.]
MAELPARAAVVGCGVIGAAWAARMRLRSVDVAVYDPSPTASEVLDAVMADAVLAWAALGLATDQVGSLTIVDSIAEAVDGAGLVQESVPERIDIKHSTLAAIDDVAPLNALIASSTSGYQPSDLATAMNHPERFVVAHPFNPVYLLPLVEVVGGVQTSLGTIDRAMDTYRALGMHPLHVRKEIDAFIADRLLEAVWREALWLVNDGIATTEEIDDAIRFGFGLRWAQMGTFETYRIAGGEGGMRHFMAQFGPALKWPWTKLMDTPELTDDLIDTIADQSDAQAGDRSIRDLAQERDRNLVAILSALESVGAGAGQTLAQLRELQQPS